MFFFPPQSSKLKDIRKNYPEVSEFADFFSIVKEEIEKEFPILKVTTETASTERSDFIDRFCEIMKEPDLKPTLLLLDYAFLSSSLRLGKILFFQIIYSPDSESSVIGFGNENFLINENLKKVENNEQLVNTFLDYINNNAEFSRLLDKLLHSKFSKVPA